ncbi:MAG TPA: BamA/TamA family outer membrane protein, partial [Polyangiaceae bacterium]|nr:BamA/TamA family outer membrane protein [Polyangiaceae bacterium]
DPGEQVRIGTLTTTGLSALPFDAAERATRAIDFRSGDAFDEDEYEKAKLDVANALADVGYAFVRVNGKARVDLSEHRASITLDVTPGPRARFGPIVIQGLREVPEKPVRDTLLLHEGEYYSQSELEGARTALFQLGVFSKVDVLPDTSAPDGAIVPVTIRLEEAPLRSVTAGFGAKLDVQRLAATGRVGWTDRNFLGGLRKLSISTRPGLTFYPTRIDHLEWPTKVLPENSLTVRLEQPSLIEGRTLGFVETGYNVYPLLYPLADGADPKLERIIGYNEVTAQVGVSRSFWGRTLPVSLSMNWRSNFPFTYQGSLDEVPGLEPVIVAYPDLTTGLDLRDNPISPTRGIFLSNSFQIAGPFLGGVLTDVRIRPEARAFYPLDYSRKVILAARVTFGFVFPQDYGSTLTGGAVTNPLDPDVVRDQHKLLFRAFYSGGPDSNRGYPYQRIGPQGPIGFLLPAGANCAAATPDPGCIRPLGGFTLWEASLELRYRFAEPWGFVWFIDASDVNAGVASINFMAPHISTGPGIRYASPIGPLRLDLGWRVPGLQQFSPQPGEPPDVSEVPPYYNTEEGRPENWFDAFAWQILIGEAF